MGNTLKFASSTDLHIIPTFGFWHVYDINFWTRRWYCSPFPSKILYLWNRFCPSGLVDFPQTSYDLSHLGFLSAICLLKTILPYFSFKTCDRLRDDTKDCKLDKRATKSSKVYKLCLLLCLTDVVVNLVVWQGFSLLDRTELIGISVNFLSDLFFLASACVKETQLYLYIFEETKKIGLKCCKICVVATLDVIANGAQVNGVWDQAVIIWVPLSWGKLH